MKEILTILLLLINSCFISAQTFLNGDFEINIATTCLFNLSNTTFNSSISNSIGFGAANELDIQQAGSCGFASSVPSGNWFISLATSPFVTADAVSLELSAPLVPGNTYLFCFYEQANLDFVSQVDSLEIGLSAVSNSFGTRIYASRAIVGVWTRQTVSFVAPNNGSFITVRNQNLQRGWNFVDDFTFNCCAVDLGPDTIMCSGQTLHLNAGSTPGSTYSWQDGSAGSGFDVALPGTYWVNVSTGICNAKDTITIAYSPLPLADLGNDRALCTNDSLVLNVASPGATYLWQNGSGSPTFTVDSAGKYWVEIALNNCYNSDTIEITETNCDVILTMPNVFSPNNDGINDVFFPLEIINPGKSELKIYNRWGEKLFETTDLAKGWNGRYNEKDCSDGIYYWIINYTEPGNNTEKIKTGWVTLLR